MKTKDKIERLRDANENILLVHYSCQSLGDANEGLSARVSSIVVTHFETSATHSFAIHLVAEKRKINKENIVEHYDALEAEVLSDFWSFASERLHYFWVHWNMNNNVFGFEALAHRYSVLTGNTAPNIDDVNKFNLSDLIAAKYGKGCLDNPKMKNLMILNGGLHRDWLDGEQESAAFRAREFNRLYKSTITKTYFFGSVLGRLLTGRRVRTNHNNLTEKISAALEHPFAKVLGFIAVIFTLYTSACFLYGQFSDVSSRASPQAPSAPIHPTENATKQQ